MQPDPTLTAIIAALCERMEDREAYARLAESARPIASYLAGSYKCPFCGNNGMGHSSAACPSLAFQDAVAELPPEEEIGVAPAEKGAEE